MSEFKIPIGEVLKTKKTHFFWMQRQADRLQAERDMRILRAFRAAQSDGEGFEAVAKSLEAEMGVIFEFGPIAPDKMVLNDEGMDPEFDREGLRALKAKFGA
ncbi:hypothetical protein HGG70_08105 [Rhodobacteraceae bacterium R_SAG4]|nr:hypothetical protein [Rhodobacteraceae bacterium R_SAG4]